MSRSEWDQLIQHQSSPIEIDISDTPLLSLANKAKIFGSFAEKSQEEKGFITIFRDDPKDAPNFINVDRYEVWENVSFHIDYPKTVLSAATSDNSALRSFLDDYVFIVPLEKGIGHHLPDVPAIYKAILENK